jgi:hypothetical protein
VPINGLLLNQDYHTDMSKPLVACLVVALLTVSGCANESSSSNPKEPSQPSTKVENMPLKDCIYFQELAYGLQNRANGGHTKIITKDFIERWTYVVMNNSKCFTQIEYCDAIDAHNSVSPWGRQESSPYC